MNEDKGTEETSKQKTGNMEKCTTEREPHSLNNHSAPKVATLRRSR